MVDVMSRAAAIIEDGVVTRLAVIDDGPAGDEICELFGWIPLTEEQANLVTNGWFYRDGQFIEPPPVIIPVDPYEVDRELNQRVSYGFVYAGKAYVTETQSQMNDILGKLGDATAAILIDGAQPGDLRWANPAYDFAWSAADNSLVPMDAQTCLAFTRAAVRRKEALVAASLAIKAMNPIPQDYRDDKYWPPMDSTAKAARK